MLLSEEVFFQQGVLTFDGVDLAVQQRRLCALVAQLAKLVTEGVIEFFDCAIHGEIQRFGFMGHGHGLLPFGPCFDLAALVIGAGFACVAQRGSTHGDSLTPDGFLSNNAGGILGGISTGQDLEVSIAIKPTSSILIPRETIDVAGESTEIITKGRHDPCVGIRATPIAEALLALVVMDHALRHRAQCGDVKVETPDIAAASRR